MMPCFAKYFMTLFTLLKHTLLLFLINQYPVLMPSQFGTEIRGLLKSLASAFVYQIEKNIAYRLIYS